MRVRLFVYGTLMRGEAAADLMAGARFVGEACTEACFTLVELDGYPALLEGGTTAVRGELYEVEEALLVRLDAYEDVPGLYRRARIGVGGEQVVAYVLHGHHAAGRPRIAGGDWRRR